MKNSIKSTTDKVAGKMLETAGQLTGNEQLELKGKLQMAKTDMKQKMDVKDNLNEMKENIAKKINDTMDKNRKE
ncbi:MAG: hypothetical protein ACERKZ_11985 [Lachnotalea sp.]